MDVLTTPSLVGRWRFGATPATSRKQERKDINTAHSAAAGNCPTKRANDGNSSCSCAPWPWQASARRPQSTAHGVPVRRQRARPARQSTGSRMPHAGRTETQPRHATPRRASSGQGCRPGLRRAPGQLAACRYSRTRRQGRGLAPRILCYVNMKSEERLNLLSEREKKM